MAVDPRGKVVHRETGRQGDCLRLVHGVRNIQTGETYDAWLVRFATRTGWRFEYVKPDDFEQDYEVIPEPQTHHVKPADKMDWVKWRTEMDAERLPR